MTAFDGSTALAVSTLAVALVVVLYVWLAVGLAAVFRKSGEEGWRGWVPILNLVVLLRLAGMSGWLLLLALIPFAGPVAVWVVVVIAAHRIGTAFGCGPGMTVLAAVLLPAWASVIGFGASRWVGDESRPAGPRGTAEDNGPLPTGARRSAPRPEYDDGVAFLAGLSDSSPPTSDFEAPYTAGSNAPGPAAPSPAQAPPRPPLPAAPPAGWVPPPLPAPAMSSADSPTTPPFPDSPTAAPSGPAQALASPPTPAASAPPAAAVPGVQASAADPALSRPMATGGAMRGSAWEGLPEGAEFTGEVTGAVSGAPAPISAVPLSRTDPDDQVAPGPMRGAPQGHGGNVTDATPPVTRVPAAAYVAPVEPWAPARSPMGDGAFSETSGEVSAIAGAPSAGSPRSALSSVSAANALPEVPEDAIEETVITQRRRPQWSLVPPSGSPIALRADTVIVGRRPVADAGYPGAQLVAIQDGTVSKSHARLELRDDVWYITDLDSTNGVLFATVMGTEVEAPPGVEVEAGDRFLLGDAEVRLIRSDA